MTNSDDISNYVKLPFDASQKTVDYIMNNYNFPLTVNTDYEEEAENVFRAYVQHAGTLLHGTTVMHHSAFLREHKRIYGAEMSKELKDMIIEALKLRDLDNLL